MSPPTRPRLFRRSQPTAAGELVIWAMRSRSGFVSSGLRDDDADQLPVLIVEDA